MGLSGLYSLSMQNSARWVLPVMSVSRCRSARSVTHGFADSGTAGQAGDLGERDLEFVERVGPPLVDPRRLRRGADEAAGEQIGQRRMTLPVGQHRDQQIGPSQQRRIGGRDAAERDVVAAAGSAVGAVDVERLGGQPGLPGFVVERVELVALLGEARRRSDVDLDDPGVGGDRHRREPRIRRRAVALDHQRAADRGRRGLDSGDQVDEVLQFVGGRQEYVQQPVPDLGDQSRYRCGLLVLGIRDDDGIGFVIGGQAAAACQRVGVDSMLAAAAS